jgi:endoglucanase Acf2
MCKTYNTIGSLTTLKLNLELNNIHDFKSLNEVINFQKSYTTLRQQLISYHENLIEQEKNSLNIDLPILQKELELQRQQAVERLTEQLDKLKQQLQILININSSNIVEIYYSKGYIDDAMQILYVYYIIE